LRKSFYASLTMPSVLLVEDDAAIAAPLARALEREDFRVTLVESGAEAIGLARGNIDLVLLDLTLPDIDGLEVCRAIRQTDRRLPVVILTARTDEADVVIGLDAGADDYVTKPFRLAELLARVRVRLRLTEPDSTVAANGVRIDTRAHRAWYNDEQLDLTPKEFGVLEVLVSDAGHVVSRQRLMHDVWDEDYYGSTRTLDMHVSALRKKLHDDPSHPRLITTVRGVGFRFEPC